MKMLLSVIAVVCMILFFSANAYSWEKVSYRHGRHSGYRYHRYHGERYYPKRYVKYYYYPAEDVNGEYYYYKDGRYYKVYSNCDGAVVETIYY